MKIDRRNFLKILGVGVTIPIAPNIIAKQNTGQNTSNPFEKKYREEFIRGFYKDYIELKGGYDELENYYWMRTTIKIDGREWHDLVRKSGEGQLDYGVIARVENNLLKRNNFQIRITEEMVRDAFEYNGESDV